MKRDSSNLSGRQLIAIAIGAILVVTGILASAHAYGLAPVKDTDTPKLLAMSVVILAAAFLVLVGGRIVLPSLVGVVKAVFGKEA